VGLRWLAKKILDLSQLGSLLILPVKTSAIAFGQFAIDSYTAWKQ